MKQLFFDYVITFGWAVVGSLSMGFGLLMTLGIISFFTKDLDEQAAIKDGNMAVALVLASVVLACAWVVSSVIRP